MEQPFNLVSNTTLKKNVADYTLIVIGAFLQALSYSLFLAPYKIVPGGVAFGHEKTRFGVRAENNCDFCLDIHFYR